DEHEMALRGRIAALDLVEEPAPVELRHREVAHDRGVDVLGEEPQRVRAVHRGIHVLPLLPQDLRLELPDVRLILDYQNARFGHWVAPLDTGMTGLRLAGGPFWCKKCTTIPPNQIRALRDRSHPLLLGSVSARAPWVTRRRAARSAGALQGRA